MKHVRKILLWILVAFFIYAVFKSPSQAASMVHGAWDIIAQASQSLVKFFNDILTRK